MPTYTYQCKDCNHRYDAFQSMSAPADTECPVCKGTVQRLIGGGAGIVFKGSGFYVTDYRKDSGGEKKSDANGKSGGERSTGGSSDSGSGSTGTSTSTSTSPSTSSSQAS
jgi:putative FmdB family regulatory protein